MYELFGCECEAVEMKKIIRGLITLSVLSCCSGPSYFNSPADCLGGNRAAAAATHCFRNGGMNQEAMAYKLCQESFNTHYGR